MNNRNYLSYAMAMADHFSWIIRRITDDATYINRNYLYQARLTQGGVK